MTPEQREHWKIQFVTLCKWGKERGLTREQLAGGLLAMAAKLAEDDSPLERYIDNPDGDNPKARPA